MTTDKTRFPIQIAELVGASLVERLEDVCDRIEVAGSIRRRRQFVGDIEILCIPKTGGLDLFGADVVEVAPPFDPSGNTALVGATMMYELLCLVAEAVAGRKAD